MDQENISSLFSQLKDGKTNIAQPPWTHLDKAIHDYSVIAETTKDEDIKSWVKSSLRDLLATQANAFRAAFFMYATVRTSEEASND